MSDSASLSGKAIRFSGGHDYTFVRELGHGSCGRTVLLRDGNVEEHLVCKKYEPGSNSNQQRLFRSFKQEIKLLYKVHHKNVVRIFTYYLYPHEFTGFILMEYVEGAELSEFLKQAPEKANDLFAQAVAGFSYLESVNILHRDIRPANIMVHSDGTLKIIDLGFGKEVQHSQDFDNSTSVNLWCSAPQDFEHNRYDFGTEVYFVGRLFEKLVTEQGIDDFKFMPLLQRMCDADPSARIGTFSEVEQAIAADEFVDIEFTEEEVASYQQCTSAIVGAFSKVSSSARRWTDVDQVLSNLREVYEKVQLESDVPDAALILRCFVDGGYRYYKNKIPVWAVRGLVNLLRSKSDGKKRIILANIHTKIDAVPPLQEYDDADYGGGDDDVPF